MEKQITFKNIIMLKDMAIIDIGGRYSFLVDFDKFYSTKPNFSLSKDNIIFPSGYIIWFDSYLQKDNDIQFEINVDTFKDENYINYKITGYINEEGEVSNNFVVESVRETIEVYLKKEDCLDTNKIIQECMKAVKTYYESYTCVFYADGSSNEVKEYLN